MRIWTEIKKWYQRKLDVGALSQFLAADHARLDALFLEASSEESDAALAAYGEFREGLLRHIGMEEKILLPALLGDPKAPRQLIEKLRLDHGALTNLFVPPPSNLIRRAIAAILVPHNKLEEEPGGLYDLCDSILAARSSDLIGKMEAAPKLPLRPYSKRPEVLEAAKRAMRRAGFDWDAVV